MPPKARITKEMIIDAAFEIAREEGAESINARTISQRLGCSTQPVMYYFKTIEEIKRAVFQKTDEYHTAFIMNFTSDDPMLDIGLNYIRFAATEKKLFCLLFQSNEFSGVNISDLISSDEVMPILQAVSQEAEVDIEQARKVFSILAFFVHGYASMLANNALEYDEQSFSKDLERVFYGAVCASKRTE